MEAGPLERLPSLFDLLDEGMALCELVYQEGACVDYVVVDANAQYAMHTGLPRTEVIGRRGSTLFESAEAPYLRECSAAVAGRARVRFDMYSARLRRHFSLLVVPVGPNSFGMVLSDIALRKSQEEALETGRLAQRALLDNQPHLAWLKDVDGRFLAVNKVFAEACGLSSPEALVGKSDLDVWPRELAEAYRADDAAVMASGRQKAVEEPIASVDGTRWFETYKSPVFAPDGSIVGTTGVARDITARKKAEHTALRAEEERRKLELSVLQAQKLESLGVLAGGIAHDFNNLLTSILGNADLALAALPPNSPARGFLDDIDLASRRAADLCRQMLAYSGKGRFVIQPISVNELVSEMGQLLSVSTSKMASLTHTFAADLPSVMADATQVRQVVMNLITNASEAIGDREGTITLRTGALSCDRDYFADAIGDSERHVAGRYVFLEVSDTGSGWTPRRWPASSIHSSRPSSRGEGSAWPPCSVSCAGTKGRSRSVHSRAKGRHFAFCCPPTAPLPSRAKRARLPRATSAAMAWCWSPTTKLPFAPWPEHPGARRVSRDDRRSTDEKRCSSTSGMDARYGWSCWT